MDIEQAHNDLAPYWAAALLVFWATGLATIWINPGPFWSGYLLDMTGPAWNYILFRGLFTTYSQNAWRAFFTPVKTLSLFLLFCFGIELAQFFNVYDSTYDPWDFLAYISILVPVFIIDLYISRRDYDRRAAPQQIE